jgi:ribonuclease-3
MPSDIPFPPARQRELEEFLRRLGRTMHQEVNWSLLDLALIHPSMDPQQNNDRLEFFGDAVLRLVVTEFLDREYPDLSVGELSALRADLISDAHLALLADLYGFERFLVMGSSAVQDDGGRQRRLADAFEAVLGALFLSWQSSPSVLSRLHAWLDTHFRERIQQLQADPVRHNAKAALQELSQSRWGILPEYRLVEAEPHLPWYRTEVWINQQCWGLGEGRSKKAATMAAAREAYAALQIQIPAQ